MTAGGWSALVAGFALLLGIVNLWYGVLRGWWREREAHAGAEFQLVHYPDLSNWRREDRVVVTNHGLAAMKRVEVLVSDEDGEPVRSNAFFMWPKMPFEVLYPGQSLYLPVHLSMGDNLPAAVTLRWHDGRRDQQSKWIGLSHHRVSR